MSAVLMDSSWESDEAFDTESDEAFDGEEAGEDAGEDFGEANRRRGRGGRPAFKPQRGVNGIAVRNQDGQVRNLKFPKKLATVEDTNKGIAKVDQARRAVAERLERLEGKYKNSSRRDSAVIGTVTLGIGLPLTVIGLAQAHSNPTTGSTAFRTWAHYKKTDAVAVSSAMQVITTGAKFLLDHRYHHSRVGIVADIFATLQLAAYGVGHFPQSATSSTTTTPPALPHPFDTLAEARAELDTLTVGNQVLTKDGKTYNVVNVDGGGTALQLVE